MHTLACTLIMYAHRHVYARTHVQVYTHIHRRNGQTLMLLWSGQSRHIVSWLDISGHYRLPGQFMGHLLRQWWHLIRSLTGCHALDSDLLCTVQLPQPDGLCSVVTGVMLHWHTLACKHVHYNVAWTPCTHGDIAGCLCPVVMAASAVILIIIGSLLWLHRLTKLIWKFACI